MPYEGPDEEGPGPQVQDEPRAPRPKARRVVTNAALSLLSKTLTKGTDALGDLERWNPSLGEDEEVTQIPSHHESCQCPYHYDGASRQQQQQHQQYQRNQQQAMAVSRQSSSGGRSESGWRLFVKYFSPSWFTVTMGTGIMASLLNRFPYGARWLYWLSIVVFCLNIALFAFFISVSILQYALYPETWRMMPKRPNQAMFLSAIPTSLSTIINMMVYVCVPAWGEWVIYTAWGLWMVDAVLSLLCGLLLPFLLIKREEELPLSNITALQIFPIIATVVAAATAALVADVIPRPEQAVVTTIIGYVLLGVGLPAGFFILIMYWQRLTIHKLPPREVCVSCFIPLGPMSMGGFALMKLGAVALKVFPLTDTIHPLAGDLAYNIGVFLALIMWGFTLLWLFLAVATIYHCKHFPFNMGWWGFTFPLGTFALSSNTLAIEIPSRFFRVIGSITSVCVFLLWLLVASATLRDVITGGKRLFRAQVPAAPAPAPNTVNRVETTESISTVDRSDIEASASDFVRDRIVAEEKVDDHGGGGGGEKTG